MKLKWLRSTMVFAIVFSVFTLAFQVKAVSAKSTDGQKIQKIISKKKILF